MIFGIMALQRYVATKFLQYPGEQTSSARETKYATEVLNFSTNGQIVSVIDIPRSKNNGRFNVRPV